MIKINQSKNANYEIPNLWSSTQMREGDCLQHHTIQSFFEDAQDPFIHKENTNETQTSSVLVSSSRHSFSFQLDFQEAISSGW